MMTYVNEQTVKFLNGLPFFRDMDPSDVTVFLNTATIRHYARHQTVFLQDDPADHFFVIRDGWVKTYRITQDGEESIRSILHGGDLFGLASFFGNADYPYCAEAVEKSDLISFSITPLRERTEKKPEIMQRVISSLSREMNRLHLDHEHMTLMSAPQRVGCLLMQLAPERGPNGCSFRFPYDKSLAAQKLGMKPETFSRAFLQLKPYGVTVNGPECRIENFDMLAQYCCAHCSAEARDCFNAPLKPENQPLKRVQ
ncbi:Crp/Fnr family transcriptional regulator [Sneathiella chinensis]|uniref:Crp/Fnr family transcriptional regulator n=1 Tax=Sneathiella chinensis TaxID=349750 RepID=A0ABQ5TYE8_9PROT|nr:Crp/Fnr family transcriptional regulator [Sneathiella chinensis]GLQ04804.1 hypothetical protein GCM10007924_00250 [Sneathiella chinensis]